MKFYRSHNGKRHSQIAQRVAASILSRIVGAILFIAVVLYAYAFLSIVSEPVSAQERNATLPPYQRCAMLGKLAYTAVWARDNGKPAQDVHVQFDDVDTLAATVIDHVYFSPALANASAGIAEQSAREACLSFR